MENLLNKLYQFRCIGENIKEVYTISGLQQQQAQFPKKYRTPSKTPSLSAALRLFLQCKYTESYNLMQTFPEGHTLLDQNKTFEKMFCHHLKKIRELCDSLYEIQKMYLPLCVVNSALEGKDLSAKDKERFDITHEKEKILQQIKANNLNGQSSQNAQKLIKLEEPNKKTNNHALVSQNISLKISNQAQNKTFDEKQSVQLKRKQEQLQQLRQRFASTEGQLRKLRSIIHQYRTKIKKLREQLLNVDQKKKVFLNNMSRQIRFQLNNFKKASQTAISSINSQLAKIQFATKQQSSNKPYIIQNHISTYPPANNHFYGNLFRGFSLHGINKEGVVDFQKERQFLISCIEKMKQKQIRNTKLLCSLNNITPMNPHQFIDQIPDYVMIIRLDNDVLLAGYSSKPLVKDEKNEDPGFIASLTNEIVLQPNFSLKNCQTTLYDPYFIVFGNSEIRIPIAANPILTSNIGSRFIYFQPRVTLQEMTNQSSKEMKINHYEIYQVIF